jgi:hypothetical protein
MGSANYVLIESELALDPSAVGSVSAVGVRNSLLGMTIGGTTYPGSQQFVRRPTRGIQLKREVFAVLSVSGVVIKNSSAQKDVPVNFTSNFLLQSIQETRQEKFQPVTTFGAPYGFFFGEQPRMVTCQAMLLNTADFQWAAEWWENYDQYLRGTRTADRGGKVSLTYEDVLLEGYLISASTSQGEPNPWAVNLTFTMWVTGVVYLIDVGGTSVDSFHTQGGRSEPSEFDEFDSDTSQGPSMLEEVRARNIKALAGSSGTGLIGAVRSAIDSFNDFTDKVGNAIDSALDWLYGRNMVIPAGFAGSERIAGSAVFAEGAGAVLLSTAGGKLTASSGSVTLRSPVRIAPIATAKGNFFDDNVDEYPTRYTSVVAPPESADFAPANPSILFAETMFANFGINVLNDTGQKTSAVMQALGRATFATISYAAAGGSAQDAAALLATATSGDFVSASSEQAAAEALR